MRRGAFAGVDPTVDAAPSKGCYGGVQYWRHTVAESFAGGAITAHLAAKTSGLPFIEPRTLMRAGVAKDDAFTVRIINDLLGCVAVVGMGTEQAVVDAETGIHAHLVLSELLAEPQAWYAWWQRSHPPPVSYLLALGMTLSDQVDDMDDAFLEVVYIPDWQDHDLFEALRAAVTPGAEAHRVMRATRCKEAATK